jgi:hypothetical protein
MAPRFQIVNAPIEQRVQTSINEQAEVAIRSLFAFLKVVNDRRQTAVNSTLTIMSDEELVKHVTSTSLSLLRPSSLPGFLLCLAVILQLVHWIALTRVCHKAVSNAELKLNGKVD